MGNQLNKEKKPKDLNELLQTTRFTEEEIVAWYKNFLKVNVFLKIIFSNENIFCTLTSHIRRCFDRESHGYFAIFNGNIFQIVIKNPEQLTRAFIAKSSPS